MNTEGSKKKRGEKTGLMNTEGSKKKREEKILAS
jgi:hypothetical protein